MKDERSIGALIMIVATLLLLGAAYQADWFAYEFSSGRTTAPDGPYNDTMAVERDMTFSAQGWEGDIEPSDTDLAKRMQLTIVGSIMFGAVLLLVAGLGELPWLATVLARPVQLVLLGIVCLVTLIVPILAWFWIPDFMAGHLVTEPFTARLDEPDGYTRTSLWWGWVWMLGSYATATGALLFKYQAGDIDPNIIESRAVVQEHHR